MAMELIKPFSTGFDCPENSHNVRTVLEAPSFFSFTRVHAGARVRPGILESMCRIQLAWHFVSRKTTLRKITRFREEESL